MALDSAYSLTERRAQLLEAVRQWSIAAGEARKDTAAQHWEHQGSEDLGSQVPPGRDPLSCPQAPDQEIAARRPLAPISYHDRLPSAHLSDILAEAILQFT